MRVSSIGRSRVTVVGDALLDVDWVGQVDRVCPDAPAPVVEQSDELVRPGGAGLAALSAAACGASTTLVTALGDDPEGDLVRELLAAAGVTLVDLHLRGPTPVKLRVRASGQSLARIDRGCDPVVRPGPWLDTATDALATAGAVLVSDYARGMAALAPFGALLPSIEAPVVWDPHVRGPVPPEGLDLLVPNRDEARALARVLGITLVEGTDDEVVTGLSQRFGCAVALTVGAGGALVARPGDVPVAVPVDPVSGDACGAGDRFAAAVTVARAAGTPVLESAAAGAAAARRHVEGGAGAPWSPVQHDRPANGGNRSTVRPGSLPRRAVQTRAGPVSPPGHQTSSPLDAAGFARAVRAAGGTVVVAGGCFDVLHAGHVQLLDAARRLGDCLIVCLNGDMSVRRLKGRHRPVNPVGDRATVLGALQSVDAVHVFDDDVPRAALQELRPHVFVKGADHADGHLPERDVLAAWGGEIVFVPVVPGRSTSRVLEIAAGTAAG